MSRMIKRVDWIRDATVEDVINWCIHRGLGPNEVTVTSSHLKWMSKESKDEKDRRKEYERQRIERTEEWERATLKRLTEKYGNG